MIESNTEYGNPPVRIGEVEVEPGERRTFELPVARLPTDTWLSMPISVVNGRMPGPRLWLSAALHGDELNGVEIIRRVVKQLDEEAMHGAVIAVPLVNLFGFVNESRYLPDRRDLNRSFPGSNRGSLASRIAHIFMNEVVSQSDVGIDLHTATDHRANLPQVRADLDDATTRTYAVAFGAPATLHARLRDGSLREAATRRGVPMLLFEGGEAHRFERRVIQAGIDGVLRIIRHLGMQDVEVGEAPETTLMRRSRWVRARRAGIFRTKLDLGDVVEKGQPLGSIGDAFGDGLYRLRAPTPGMVIGIARNPLVYQGNGLIHLGETG